MTDAEIIAAIRREHLEFSDPYYVTQDWRRAWLDPGFGDGSYVHRPVTTMDGDHVVIRVYPTTRLLRALNGAWAAKIAKAK